MRRILQTLSRFWDMDPEDKEVVMILAVGGLIIGFVLGIITF